MIEAILNYQFMQNAIISCLLASLVCGMIGVIIVEKNMLMLSGGIAHTAYGGVGLGYLLGFEPIWGAVGFSVAAAFGIGFVKRHGGGGADVMIAMFWSLGMALGIVFIGLAPGYQPNISSYLFGNILSVTRGDLLLMAGLALIITCLVIVFFNNWQAYLFDEEFAHIIGLRTVLFEYLLLVIVALTVVVLIRMAG
ncbi:MAG: metal ABC transporter permease, partial [Clostridia bacterium]|nr:metal ABC transporter permease [Clostridia bacterium]